MRESGDGRLVGKNYSIGAIPCAQGTQFRIWAPIAHKVEVVVNGKDLRYPLGGEEDGYFSGLLQEVGVGSLYRFSLDGGEAFPDPASRYQPEGPHGPSQIIDPRSYVWSEAETHWPGVSIEGQVLYELHIGTLTSEGTFLSALHEFSRLRDIGITLLECMPLAEFPGNVGWGYDGVDLFAPFHRYGHPDDLRRMIDAAHQLGLGVLLDVVYNHLGPDGNYLGKYSDHYFSDKKTDWGNAINFDGENSKPVRDFFSANVAHWIDEYHFDGLRLDATQSIHDTGSHGLTSLQRLATACARQQTDARPLSLQKTSHRMRPSSATSTRTATALTRCGMTTFITALSSRLLVVERLISATISGILRSLSQLPNTAFYIRDNTIRGNSTHVARRASILVAELSSPSLKTMTR